MSSPDQSDKSMLFKKNCFITIMVFLVYSCIKLSFAGSVVPGFISSPPSRIEGYTGDSLRIVPCVCGSKPLDYTWMKNDSIIQSSSSVLFFDNLCEDNQGSYMCIVSNEFGSDTSEMFQIDVLQKLNAKFQINPKEGKAPLKVNFFNKSEGRIKNVHWSFGDGTFSNLKNPIHTFKNPGTFYIKLTITGDQIPDTSIIVKKIDIIHTELTPKTNELIKNIDISDNKHQHENKKTHFLIPRFFRVKYCGGDSVRIVFHNSNQDADSILLWYGKGKNADFSDSSCTKRIDPGFFYCESDTDSLVFVIRDSCFKYCNELLNIALIFKKDEHISDTIFSPVIFETRDREKHVAYFNFIDKSISDKKTEKDLSKIQKKIELLTKRKENKTNKKFSSGYVFESFITNKSAHSDTVKHAVNLLSSISSDFSVETIDPSTANPVDLIILNPSESKKILIIAGTDSFRDSIKKQIELKRPKLVKNKNWDNYINLCQYISYTKSGRVLLMIMDRYGRCLWHYSLLEIFGGINEFILYRRSKNNFSILPSGLLILKFPIFEQNGKRRNCLKSDL